MQNDNVPLVSVVVLSYNSSDFILETLNSIKSQTYPCLELVITDDSSTDDTVNICKTWISNNSGYFSKVELLVSDKNMGIPSNCNKGIALANGDWIKIIAADDVLLNDCIQNNINFVSSFHSCNIVFSCSNRYLDNFNDKCFIKRFPNTVPDCFCFPENYSSQQQFQLLLNSNEINAPTVFIKKSLIYKVGMFDEKYPFMEDYPMWLKITKGGYKIFFLDMVTVKHRIHQKSVDSFNTNEIFKTNYFKLEEFRQDYIYPNLPIYDVLREKYRFLIRKILAALGMNVQIRTFVIVHNLLTHYLNPFTWISFVVKKVNSLK